MWCAALFCTYQHADIHSELENLPRTVRTTPKPTVNAQIGTPGYLLSSCPPKVSSRTAAAVQLGALNTRNAAIAVPQIVERRARYLTFSVGVDQHAPDNPLGFDHWQRWVSRSVRLPSYRRKLWCYLRLRLRDKCAWHAAMPPR